MLKKWATLFVSLLIGVWLAIVAISPPSPEAIDIAANQFSSARAMKDVRIISAKPHPTGSEEIESVRKFLIERLNNLGADIKIEISPISERALKRLNKWSGEGKIEQDIINVIGIIPGEDRSKSALLLMAHYDTVWDSPGAADDTIGLASILEITRALKEDEKPFQRDLIILFTDGEEIGLAGAERQIYFRHRKTMEPRLNSMRNPLKSRAPHHSQPLCIMCCLMTLI